MVPSVKILSAVMPFICTISCLLILCAGFSLLIFIVLISDPVSNKNCTVFSLKLFDFEFIFSSEFLPSSILKFLMITCGRFEFDSSLLVFLQMPWSGLRSFFGSLFFVFLVSLHPTFHRNYLMCSN